MEVVKIRLKLVLFARLFDRYRNYLNRNFQIDTRFEGKSNLITSEGYSADHFRLFRLICNVRTAPFAGMR